jgi:phosphatidylserine/phosphatidylglycerophosphate/cardiolipin synthase-like enzyme
MDIRLEDKVRPGGLEQVVFDLLKWLEANGRTGEFIDVLASKRPHLKEALAGLRDIAAARPGTLEQPAPNPTEPLTPIHAPDIWKKAFVVRGARVAYASPDTTYDALEERLSKAQKSLLIAMYEFTSQPVKNLMLKTVERGVKTTLLIDSKYLNDERKAFLAELRRTGIEVVEAPPGGRNRMFPLYHPKIIIIDEVWVLIQTGNLTPTSVPAPLERAGNRDVGIALESAELAQYFGRLLGYDKRLFAQVVGSGSSGSPKENRKYPIYEPVPTFPMLRIGVDSRPDQTPPPAERPIRILPVHAPDNYSTYVSQVLISSRSSIDIVAPYLHPNKRSPTLQQLLDAIKTTRFRNPGLRVRLILGWLDARRSLEMLRSCCGWLSTNDIRILNPRSGLNLTSKLLIVDQRVSLVTSANWSEPGITKNREIGVMVDSPVFAAWYGK